jgi:hypothetical protein
VQTADGKYSGYIASAYLREKLNSPHINPVDDNDTFISGKALPSSQVTIKYGTKQVQLTSDTYGLSRKPAP